MEPTNSLLIEPIGFMRTTMRQKFDAPHQPSDPSARVGTIELLPKRGFEVALQDLIGFERIWLLWWFHKNSTWRPKVLPPRGQATRRGLFATRSPHRPNPLGLSAVKLLDIRGLKVSIGECDLIDGTPILDIKPYIPEIDSFENSKIGWLGQIEAELPSSSYKLEFSPEATEQINWLKENFKLDFISRAADLLSRDPTPHRTRRISKRPDGTLRMGCGAWRIFYRLIHKTVMIDRIAPGYPQTSLESSGYERIPDREAQLIFNQKWQTDKD